MTTDKTDRWERENRGRDATRPSEIPAPGWKDVLSRAYRDISEHRILAIAAGVTFYALLAIFPAIAAFVALYSLFAAPGTVGEHLEALSGVLPSEVITVVGQQIRRIEAQGGTTLGLASILGLLLSLWSANAGMKAIFDALNVVYEEDEKRGFFRLNAVSLAFTILGMASVALVLAVMVALPPAVQALGAPSPIPTLVLYLRWPLLLILVAVAISAVYRFGPSRDQPKWRWVSWGGAFAALAWLAASLLFTWYAANLGKFNETYGSLGAVVASMLWMWVSTIVLLVGAELNAETEHQTAQDSTVGPPRPLGERGATMADTVGERAS